MVCYSMNSNAHCAHIINYHASDMILKIFSDGAFLVLPQAQIRSAAIYHLVCKDNKKRTDL